MIWLWLGFALSVLLALFALASLALWIHELILETGLLREQRLWGDRISTLFGLAISASCSTFFAFSLYLLFIPIEGFNALQNDIRFGIILWWSVGMLAATVPLWLYSFFLTLLARRRPRYVFLLPQDAANVRTSQCISGMYLAAILLPKEIKEEFLDPFIRSIAVSSRAATFPVGKRQKTIFTNDFGVYCNLAVEAASTGYHAIVRIFEEDHARYERLEPLIKAYPEVDGEQKQRLFELARQFIEGDTGESGETHLA